MANLQVAEVGGGFGRLRLHGVDRGFFDPALVEDEGRRADRFAGMDLEPRLVEEAAANVFGGRDLEGGRRGNGFGARRTGAGDIQQRCDHKSRHQQQESAAQNLTPVPALEVSVPREVVPCGRSAICRRLGRGPAESVFVMA